MSAQSRKDGLVRPSQIRKWEREYASLGKQSQRIEQRRSLIKTMIDAAKTLTPRDPDGTAAPSRRRRSSVTKRRGARSTTATPTPTPEAAPAASQANPSHKKDRRREVRSPWKIIIREIALTSNHPVPYAEARQEIMKTDLAEKLQQSEKGFYASISKLNKDKEIVAYKGHLFSPELFRKFKADVDAGVARDLKIPNAAHVSPMGNAIEALMLTRPKGALSGNIIWELRKNPEFATTIEKNKTHPYNVLRRLLVTGVLVKKGKRYYSAIPKTEAPPKASSEGASNLFGEGGTSPVEGQGAA